MFDQILIGVDGKEGGRDAIALAKRLATAHAQLTFACVSINDPRVYRSAGNVLQEDERTEALEMLDRAKSEAGVEADTHYVLSTSAGRGLHQIAETLPADLLVVGSSRRSLVGRVLIGDDTRAALNASPCAVAIAPAGFADTPGTMREIGVGYNESPESEHALEVARQIASQHGARLSAFEAVSLPRYLFSGSPEPIDQSLEDFVSAARERIAKLGGVEPHAAYGHAAEELALYSASLDLLVVGSRGYGPVGRLIHGSTSEVLARTARCPLLVLPRGARANGDSA